jgi:hypothetical protein
MSTGSSKSSTKNGTGSRGGSKGSNLKMPDLDFGGFGDAEEEDEQAEGLPAEIFGAGPVASSSPVEGTVESKPPLVPRQPLEESALSSQSPTEQRLEAPTVPPASAEIHTPDISSGPPPASSTEAPDGNEPAKASTADAAGPAIQSPISVLNSAHADTEAAPLVESAPESAAVARRESTQSVASWGSSSGLPARRPRRNTSKPFTADQRQVNREQSMRELFEKAPRYASLLNTYAMVKKTDSKSRNIQLYGLAFERTATQIAIDTAVMARITPRMPTPRLIAGHYVDTALQGALSELNPAEADAERIEDEKDIVFKLAERAIAYRNYIADDDYASQLKHSRTICPLTQFGDALLTRLMTLLRTMPALKVQPFEIVSVAVSDLLDGMAQEQEAFEGFLARSVETSIQ